MAQEPGRFTTEFNQEDTSGSWWMEHPIYDIAEDNAESTTWWPLVLGLILSAIIALGYWQREVIIKWLPDSLRPKQSMSLADSKRTIVIDHDTSLTITCSKPCQIWISNVQQGSYATMEEITGGTK